MVSIWNYDDYKIFLKDWVKEAREKRGVLKRLSENLKVHPSRLSRILNEYEHPSTEQAYLMASFMKMDAGAVEYFLELINLEKAVSAAFKKHVKEKLKKIKDDHYTKASAINITKELSLAQEKIYYSSYEYGAVRMASFLENNEIAGISKVIGLEKSRVESIAKFLETIGLCKIQNGKIIPGARVLKLEKDSPHLNKFLFNWRMHSLNKIEVRKTKDYYFSAPMALGEESSEEIKQLIKSTLEKIKKIAMKDSAKNIKFLNIDFGDI